jgi:hypothetical protein
LNVDVRTIAISEIGPAVRGARLMPSAGLSGTIAVIVQSVARAERNSEMPDVTAQRDPDLLEPALIQPVEGSGRPARVYLAPTLDGLYTPYALRTPADEGTFPFVFLAYGNGGGGIGWLRRRLRTHGHIMERLLRAGYACAWGRYRTEVELGYHNGGPLAATAGRAWS